MSSKLKYYQIFGLTETATKAEVKRAYRKLVMKYHPDRNTDPGAHKLFLDLTAAYDRLMNDRPVAAAPIYTSPSSTSQTRKETSEEERVRVAQERLKNQTERLKLQEDLYYKNLTTGLRWKIFTITAFLGLFISCTLFLEKVLPTHFEQHVLVGYSSIYNGLEHRDVRYLKTNRGVGIFVPIPPEEMLYKNPEFILETSFLMHNPIKLWYQNEYTSVSRPIDFTINSAFPLFPLILLLPIFAWKYKRKSYVYVMLYLISQYLVGATLLFLLYSNDRWLHILTLGFY